MYMNTSIKLDELKNSRIVAIKLRNSIEDIDSAEYLAAEVAVTKIAADIKAEVANIERELAAAKIAEAKAAKMAFITNFEDSLTKCVLLHSDKKSTLEDKQAASELLTTAKEALINQLFSGGKIANVSAPTDKVAGERGAKSAAIKARASELFAQGLDGKTVRSTIIGEGYNDGTANQVILNLEYELGLKVKP